VTIVADPARSVQDEREIFVPVARDIIAAQAAGAQASNLVDSHVPGLVAGAGGPFMRPVWVGACFGWLHTKDATTGGDVAALICPGLARDRLDAHHSLRLLADALADAGYPAMRFDYPGTGDSADLQSDGEPWQNWQRSAHAAVDWLRATTGATRVILAGLRVGATLAALAVEQRDDVAALALLAPALRGRSYIQQLQMEARLQRGEAAPRSEGLEFHEVQFDAATINRIAEVDLRELKLPPGLHVAMFMQAASKLGNDCADAWSGQGAKVFSVGFAGLEPLLRHNEETEGTPPDFSELLAWIRRTVPAKPVPLLPLAWPEESLAQLGWIETPQRFGPGDGLFGMLCRPDRPHGDMAVIIGNIGRDPHYGVARFGVEFARHLAALGIASLRIDFAGLGDSIGPPGKADVLTSMFETSRDVDISAAAAMLADIGYRRIAMQGICAGAYHTLRGALAEPRIGTLLLVNLPVFEWHAGDTVDFVYRRTMKPGRYLTRLGNIDDWKRVARGDFHVGEVIVAQSARIWQRLREGMLRLAERQGWLPPQSVGRLAMAALAQRGVRTLFLFSPDDNGIDAMEQEFGRDAVGLRGRAQVAYHIEPQLDHLLSTPAMRRAAIQIMAQFLGDWPTSGTGAAAGHGHPAGRSTR